MSTDQQANEQAICLEDFLKMINRLPIDIQTQFETIERLEQNNRELLEQKKREFLLKLHLGEIKSEAAVTYERQIIRDYYNKFKKQSDECIEILLELQELLQGYLHHFNKDLGRWKEKLEIKMPGLLQKLEEYAISIHKKSAAATTLIQIIKGVYVEPRVVCSELQKKEKQSLSAKLKIMCNLKKFLRIKKQKFSIGGKPQKQQQQQQQLGQAAEHVLNSTMNSMQLQPAFSRITTKEATFLKQITRSTAAAGTGAGTGTGTDKNNNSSPNELDLSGNASSQANDVAIQSTIPQILTNAEQIREMAEVAATATEGISTTAEITTKTPSASAFSVNAKRDLKDIQFFRRLGSKFNFQFVLDFHEKLCCICEKLSCGTMVACDNEFCPYEWFHFKCVNLQLAPTDELLHCPLCVQTMLAGDFCTFCGLK